MLPTVFSQNHPVRVPLVDLLGLDDLSVCLFVDILFVNKIFKIKGTYFADLSNELSPALSSTCIITGGSNIYTMLICMQRLCIRVINIIFSELSIIVRVFIEKRAFKGTLMQI